MTSQNRPLKAPPLTDDLIKQDFRDVLYAFFDLEDLCKKNLPPHTKNYVTIRLATIIEQFCRKIVENQIKHKKGKIPKEITIKTQDLDEIIKAHTKYVTKNISNDIQDSDKIGEIKQIVIAASYSFQNIDAIKDLKDYEIIGIFDDDNLKDAIDELMSKRHDVVHTVIDTDYDVQKGFKETGKLLTIILSKSVFENESIFYIIRGNYKLTKEKYKDAIESYDESIKIKPNSFAYNGKGNALYQLEKYKDAIESYDESIKIKSTFLAYNGKGNALYRLEKYKDAIESYDESIKIEPNSFAYSGKGNALYRLEKYKDAIESHDESIKIEPNYFAYSGKGNALYRLEKYKDAIESYDESIKIEPNSFAYNGKGDALYQLGKYKDAIESHDESIKIEPNYFAYSGKGDALSKLGRDGEAKYCYELANEL